MSPVIVFWDIDGTLVHTAGAGMEAWRRSLEEMRGMPTALPALPTAGLTDVLIAGRLAEAVGLPSDDSRVTDRLLERYLEILPQCLEEAPGRVLPNVAEILEQIDARADVHSLLLTGNVAAGASIKLGCFGLLDYFDGGAFADGIDDRVLVAQRAAVDARGRFGSGWRDRAVVLGDTPADIDCGHAIGARTIGVATGPYGVEDLAARSPWRTFEQLPPACDMLALIAGATAPDDPEERRPSAVRKGERR